MGRRKDYNTHEPRQRFTLNDEDGTRAIELLQAVNQLLERCDSAQYEVMGYDGAICDGLCLKGDVEVLLESVGAPLMPPAAHLVEQRERDDARNAERRSKYRRDKAVNQ